MSGPEQNKELTTVDDGDLEKNGALPTDARPTNSWRESQTTAVLIL
jgi:hypothetical protein